MANRFQVLIEFLHHWHAGGNVEVDNLIVGHVFEVLDQRPQAVAMGGDQNLFA